MAQHNVVDYTKQYDNLLMSYGEHSQIQRYTYGLELISMDFIALDDHDNGWIPSGTETAYVDQWDTLYYLHDDLGTVNKVIGSSGKTSAHYNYDEFGRPLGAVKLDPNWSGPDNAIAYTGYTYDHFAGLYYAQARYYQPEVGRFISQDPWAGNLTQPGTLNPYPYVLNNPLRYVDPLGLAYWEEDCPQANSSGNGLNGLVGLRDWINQVEGSVTWNPNTRVAIASYNGITRQYDIRYYQVRNDHIMVDLDQLLQDFNYVPNEKPVEVIPIWDDPIFYITQGVVGLGRAGIGAFGKTAVREGAELVPGGAGNAGVKATQHGAQRLAERGFSEVDVILTKSTNIIKTQADGAQVYIKEVTPGRFNVIVESENDVVTALKNISEKSLDRLSKNYEWK